MSEAEFYAVTGEIAARLCEPTVHDLLDSVSVAAAKRRRPKVARRDRVTMEQIKVAEVDKAVKQAVRESRAALDRSEARRLALASRTREITKIAAAAAEELSKPPRETIRERWERELEEHEYELTRRTTDEDELE
jgi:hypothetical protein